MRAAVAAIGESGYERASMRHIAARAGVSASAIYHHFPSKQDLLGEFLEGAWRSTNAHVEQRIACHPGDPAAQLDEVVDALVTGPRRDEFARRAWLVATREAPRLTPDERARIEGLRSELLRSVESVLLDGTARGVFAVADADVRDVARAIVAVATPSSAVRTDEEPPLADVLAMVCRFARRLAGAETPRVDAPSVA